LRQFSQASAYTKHQHSCTKGKKRLFSALSKAKEFLGSGKRSKVHANDGRQYARSSMTSSSTQAPPLSSDQANNSLNTEFCQTLSAVHPLESCAGLSLQTDTHIPPLNPNLSISSMEVDEGLSLAQRRSRRIDVPLPIRYRQYEDVLPQPPPSIPNYTTQRPESVLSAHSSDEPAKACTSSAAPFRTARNIFGLARQFFSSTPPCHDPEEAMTLQDVSFIPVTPGSLQDNPVTPHDNLYYPYPNESSFKLGHWYWNDGVQKSHQSFKNLLDIVGSPDYDPHDVQHTHWDKINSQLGSSVDDEGDEWEDEDAGWLKTEVVINVPFSRTTAQPGPRPYVAADLYHRSLVSVIREKLANAHDDEHFHYEPYQLQWSPPHLLREVNIQGELYTSPAFMDAHRALQVSPGEPSCDLPRVVAALMFWSDATQLTTFGNAKLWPVYMYFGNESKYHRCRPTCHLSNHVAYFQKV
jgi:Plavaka transposase